MELGKILSVHRVAIGAPGDAAGKEQCLRRLGELLATDHPSVDEQGFYTALSEREGVQSTGIGAGVAVPHATLPGLEGQRAALLICPEGVEFDSIDEKPVFLLFALVGPPNPLMHLKSLARVSRLFRRSDIRANLVTAHSEEDAYAQLLREDAAHQGKSRP